LESNEPVTEVARYRVACLLALGRTQDAKAAVAETVLAHPEYVPDGSETSPRVMELFRAARRTTVPGVARALYAEARAAMERKDLAGAVDRFERVIRLADDPELADNTALADMKLLATDFLELARLRAAKAPAASPAAAPAETPKPAGPVTPAVPINQQLPPWTPLDSLGKRWEFSGVVRVVIGADGQVRSARIERSVHPAYDTALLNAARRWTYHPALQDGRPVESERTVQVVLKPPR
jgi:protein TonB